ncbi:MAG: MarR family transcriptional regulator [Edaphobacter sp.]|nr:MarR family transcriptional regulator [Edaphobacter sp.]
MSSVSEREIELDPQRQTSEAGIQRGDVVKNRAGRGGPTDLRNVNVLHSVLERVEPELSSVELDTKRLFILCMVDANPFPADLARALSLPKPSMTFLVKKLEESGYLRRQGEKGDLRRYRLTITPAGIKARDKGADAANRIFGACLNSFSAADQATFRRIVDQLQPRTSKTKQRGSE